jgi:phospholipid/cholesterol/gamma-HCH transport system permease protein
MTRAARMTTVERSWTFTVERPTPAVACVELTGAWRKEDGLPDASEVWREIQGGLPVRRLTFDTSRVTDWDSGLITFAINVLEEAKARGIESDRAGLPEGAQRLLRLAEAVPERQTGRARARPPWLARIGARATASWGETGAGLAFLGAGALAFGALLRGRARFRMVDLLGIIQDCGPRALGIVSLISFLIGLILGFVGAVQLQQFGASIFVANLVAIGVTRELGALMTGIVMAGRTGASFAAVLGTMTVNEEVDALETMGLKPVQFLVLPRVLATSLMLPALVAYADALGILGGTFVGVAMLDLGAVEYLRTTQSSLALRHVVIGLVKSVAFGVVVALTGCYYGIRSGRTAAAVGDATTRAVVMGIVLVVIVDAAFTVLLHVLRL